MLPSFPLRFCFIRFWTFVMNFTKFSDQVFEDLIPCDVAHLILGDYLRYHHQYKRINKRARIRFERRDW